MFHLNSDVWSLNTDLKCHKVQQPEIIGGWWTFNGHILYRRALMAVLLLLDYQPYALVHTVFFLNSAEDLRANREAEMMTQVWMSLWTRDVSARGKNKGVVSFLSVSFVPDQCYQNVSFLFLFILQFDKTGHRWFYCCQLYSVPSLI